MTKIVRGKECDPKDHFPWYFTRFELSDIAENDSYFLGDNHLFEWMDYFSLKENGDLIYCFTLHECECGLPSIICRASHHLKHKYISPENKRKLEY